MSTLTVNVQHREPDDVVGHSLASARVWETVPRTACFDRAADEVTAGATCPAEETARPYSLRQGVFAAAAERACATSFARGQPESRLRELAVAPYRPTASMQQMREYQLAPIVRSQRSASA